MFRRKSKNLDTFKSDVSSMSGWEVSDFYEKFFFL